MFKLVRERDNTKEPVVCAAGDVFRLRFKDPSGYMHEMTASLPAGVLDYWAIYHATGEYGLAECYCAYLVLNVDDDDYFQPGDPPYDLLSCVMVVRDYVVFQRIQQVPKRK